MTIVAASGAFSGPLHRFPVRVYVEDTDLGGVVYHGNYIRYLERARTEMLRALDIDARRAIEDGTGIYMIAALAIEYRLPAKLDDDLLIESQVARRGASLTVIHQRVMRGEAIIALAEVSAVFASLDGKPKRQPAAWLKQFDRVIKGEL
jgi:acyl-CoA thioester hydrolase